MSTCVAMGMRRLAEVGRALCGTLVLLAGGGVLEAQNMIWNGDFDADVSGWTPRTGASLLWTDLSDEAGCSGSGMGLTTSVNLAGTQVASMSQCVGPLTPGQGLYVRARHLGYGDFSIELDFMATFDCETGLISGWGSPFVPQDPVVWSTSELATTVPANAFGVRVRLIAGYFEPHGLGVDGVVVARRPPLLLDGFEGDDPGSTTPCRWN